MLTQRFVEKFFFLEAVDLRAKFLKSILQLASYSHHGKKEHKAVEFILVFTKKLCSDDINSTTDSLIPRPLWSIQ